MAVRWRTKVSKSGQRTKWEFEEGTAFQQVKAEVITEIEEVMRLQGVNRVQLARMMDMQPSALSQSLSKVNGLQLSTLVRIAEALECDIEVNLIRRGPVNAVTRSSSANA